MAPIILGTIWLSIRKKYMSTQETVSPHCYKVPELINISTYSLPPFLVFYYSEQNYVHQYFTRNISYICHTIKFHVDHAQGVTSTRLVRHTTQEILLRHLLCSLQATLVFFHLLLKGTSLCPVWWAITPMFITLSEARSEIQNMLQRQVANIASLILTLPGSGENQHCKFYAVDTTRRSLPHFDRT